MVFELLTPTTRENREPRTRRPNFFNWGDAHGISTEIRLNPPAYCRPRAGKRPAPHAAIAVQPSMPCFHNSLAPLGVRAPATRCNETDVIGIALPWGTRQDLFDFDKGHGPSTAGCLVARWRSGLPKLAPHQWSRAARQERPTETAFEEQVVVRYSLTCGVPGCQNRRFSRPKDDKILLR